MATITIKIESEQLAREVLTQLGYLPDDVPDLISVESEEDPKDFPELPRSCSAFRPKHIEKEEPVRSAPKTHVEAILEHLDSLPKGTRNMPYVQKHGEFCTTEDPKEDDVEPVENELGASLDVFSEETAKEQDALYQQSLEVHKSLMAAGRLKKTADQLMGDELLNYLDAMCDHSDKEMREAAKAMVRTEFAGHTLKMWPALQKVLDSQE